MGEGVFRFRDRAPIDAAARRRRSLRTFTRPSLFPRSAADAADAADTLLRGQVSSRVAADNAASADSLTRVFGRTRSLSDNAAAADVLVRTQAKVTVILADNAAANDGLLRLRVSARSISDLSAALDVLSRLLALSRSLADAAAGGDSLVRSAFTPARSLADNAASTDSLTRVSARSRSLADTAAAADSLSAAYVPGTNAISRSVSDNAAASDSLTRSWVATRSLSDAAAGADSLTRLRVSARTLADNSAASDSLTRARTSSRPLADNAAASDSLVRSTIPYVRTLSDNAAASDSLSRVRTASRSTSDGAAAADSLSRLWVAARTLADNAAASDVVSRSIVEARTVADNAAATDALTRLAVSPRSLADNATASDLLVRSAFTPSRSIADAAASSDSLARQSAFVRSVSDNASASDSLTRSVSRSLSLSDSAGASDVLVRSWSVSRTLSDASAASDSLLRSFVQARSLADNAAASDSLISVKGPTRNLSDAAAANDSLVRGAIPFSRSVSDNAAASDSLARISAKARTLADNSFASDALVRSTVPFARSLSDNAAASDVVSRLRVSARSLSDGSAASDSLSRAFAASRSVSDNAAASDSLSRLAVRSRTLADNAAASDSLARQRVTARTVSDTAAANDSLVRLVVRSRALSDNAAASDSLSRLRALSRSLSDNAAASDSLTRQRRISRSVSDVASASDALARRVVRSRSLSDSASASDSLSSIPGRIRVLADNAAAADLLVRAPAEHLLLEDGTDLLLEDGSLLLLVSGTGLALHRSLSDAAAAADVLTRASLTRVLADNAAATDSLTAATGSAGTATGTGTAFKPSRGTGARLASGTGIGRGAKPTIKVNAGLASGIGRANTPLVSGPGVTNVSAGVAGGTGRAFSPYASLPDQQYIAAQGASGSGIAFDAQVLGLAPHAGLASGKGKAFFARIPATETVINGDPQPQMYNNDDFAGAYVIEQDSGSFAGTSVGYSDEVCEPLPPNWFDNASNDYRFQINNTAWFRYDCNIEGTMWLDVDGNFDTVLTVWEGMNSEHLEFVTQQNGDYDFAANEWGGSYVRATMYAGKRYYIGVSGYAGDSGNYTLTWDFTDGFQPGQSFYHPIKMATPVGTYAGNLLLGSDEAGSTHHANGWELDAFALWFQFDITEEHLGKTLDITVVSDESFDPDFYSGIRVQVLTGAQGQTSVLRDLVSHYDDEWWPYYGPNGDGVNGIVINEDFFFQPWEFWTRLDGFDIGANYVRVSVPAYGIPDSFSMSWELVYNSDSPYSNSSRYGSRSAKKLGQLPNPRARGKTVQINDLVAFIGGETERPVQSKLLLDADFKCVAHGTPITDIPNQGWTKFDPPRADDFAPSWTTTDVVVNQWQQAYWAGGPTLGNPNELGFVGPQVILGNLGVSREGSLYGVGHVTDIGQSDMIIRMRWGGMSSIVDYSSLPQGFFTPLYDSPGVVFRYKDANNFWFAQNFSLFKFIDGQPISVWNGFNQEFGAYNTGMEFSIYLRDDEIIMTTRSDLGYVSRSDVREETPGARIRDPYLKDETSCGFYLNVNLDCLDYFRVYSPAGGSRHPIKTIDTFDVRQWGWVASPIPPLPEGRVEPAVVSWYAPQGPAWAFGGEPALTDRKPCIYVVGGRSESGVAKNQVWMWEWGSDSFDADRPLGSSSAN
jgi:hypothetical protein